MGVDRRLLKKRQQTLPRLSLSTTGESGTGRVDNQGGDDGVDSTPPPTWAPISATWGPGTTPPPLIPQAGEGAVEGSRPSGGLGATTVWTGGRPASVSARWILCTWRALHPPAPPLPSAPFHPLGGESRRSGELLTKEKQQ